LEVSRGSRGTGSPSLDILHYLPTGFLLIVHTQLPLASILSFVFLKSSCAGTAPRGVVAQELFKMGLLDCFITEVAQQYA
jgi:hypothetical protein